MNASSWRIWPFVAAFLALLFIAWDIALVSRARKVQDRIGEQVGLLDRLSRLHGAVDQLGLAHRVDVNTGQHNWTQELQRTNAALDGITERYGNEPSIGSLHERLKGTLHHCDSLHQEVVKGSVDAGAAHRSEAVFALLLQRARDHVEGAVRTVHEQGLVAQTSILSGHWDEAQTLLFLACMFAVVFALLVGMTRRLLVQSRERSALLSETSRHLEETNRELRETMLSKEEKEVMIKEIHHRVKNNLQIVRSLIRFQTDKVSDPKMLELFNECINRVGAMALVHEQTYLSKDLANIGVSGYLDSLVRDLVSAYNIRVKLKMDVDIRVKTLGVDTLIPLGLIINEVISNSFKYAFQGREQGTITVHLSGTESGLNLRVGDDGVGLPDRRRWEKPQSLGMELIHTLADQLNASVDLLPVPGTMYELRSTPYPVRKTA
ncbi:MAG: sensor histidine kinase [Bacteroidetes bacterium]|nr:sensor histidine kinase [Bacteroidota bacterium]